MPDTKAIEDAVCDFVDSAIGDSIVCMKEMDMNQVGYRAAYLAHGIKSLDDHSVLWRGTVSVSELVSSRSKAIEDMDKIRAALPFYRKKTEDGFAISMIWGYSIVPIRMIVGDLPAYFVTANMEITTN